ncbi:hypothetical protein [Calycomorphotria hydatis]|uniref:Uncharacterized protein n=1 Tax=Calycomorphotria hydatis TaxID=2528027 RepID=A0A517T6F9_9PLAN|nr:hypothetical protein [Calycomorphotria hydatis]QDT63941.1 hypothetical protein V22_11700 [Calycomorphotria hydatis]
MSPQRRFGLVGLIIGAVCCLGSTSTQAGDGYYYAAPSYYYGPPVVVAPIVPAPVPYSAYYGGYAPYYPTYTYRPVVAYRAPVYVPYYGRSKWSYEVNGPFGDYEVEYKFRNGYVEIDIDD